MLWLGLMCFGENGTLHPRYLYKFCKGPSITDVDFHKKPMKVDFVSVKCVDFGYDEGP